MCLPYPILPFTITPLQILQFICIFEFERSKYDSWKPCEYKTDYHNNLNETVDHFSSIKFNIPISLSIVKVVSFAHEIDALKRCRPKFIKSYESKLMIDHLWMIRLVISECIPLKRWYFHEEFGSYSYSWKSSGLTNGLKFPKTSFLLIFGVLYTKIPVPNPFRVKSNKLLAVTCSKHHFENSSLLHCSIRS